MSDDYVVPQGKSRRANPRNWFFDVLAGFEDTLLAFLSSSRRVSNSYGTELNSQYRPAAMPDGDRRRTARLKRFRSGLLSFHHWRHSFMYPGVTG